MTRALLLGVLLLALATVTPSSASFPAPGQRIVSVSESLAGAGVTLMNGDGTDVRPLGFPVGVHGAATFSPDGTRLAVTETVPLDPSVNQYGSDILVGSLLDSFEQVTNDQADDGRASWAPDGTRIAFASNRDGDWDVYVATLGGATVNVTAGSPASELNPRWSPDGRTLAFESDRSGNVDVYAMAPDGSGVVNLTKSPAADTLGDWSPDSSRLVFSSTRAGDADLYVMPAGGGAAARITHDPGAETHAAWSPDGRLIAYSSDRDGDNEIYSVAPDGSGQVRLTTNAAEDLVQDWQPVQDLQPPRPRALRSTGRRGKDAYLRFRLAENSGKALVQLEFDFASPGGAGVGFAVLTLAHVNARRVYRVPISLREIRLAQSFRFCVEALDPSFNNGARSCARFTYVKPKPKRR